MTDDDGFIRRVVSDLYLVANHVAEQPCGYDGVEVQRAKYLLHTVDVGELAEMLHSVLFVSRFFKGFGPLTETESQVEQAALRLDRLQRSIRMNQSQIQARMAA